MYSLDSDVVIEFLKGNQEIIDKINNLENKGIRFFITPIVLCELYEGAYKSTHVEKDLELIDNFLIRIEVLNFLIEGSRLFGKVKALLRKKGKPTQDFDLLTASLTLSNDLILITRNKKHFENIPNLKVEVW